MTIPLDPAAWRIGLPLHARARRAYLVGGLSLFVAMSLTYWGARHIHSGLVSLIFGLAPLLTGLFARYWLPNQPLHRHELIGASLGVGGLAAESLADQRRLQDAYDRYRFYPVISAGMSYRF